MFKHILKWSKRNWDSLTFSRLQPNLFQDWGCLSSHIDYQQLSTISTRFVDYIKIRSLFSRTLDLWIVNRFSSFKNHSHSTCHHKLKNHFCNQITNSNFFWKKFILKCYVIDISFYFPLFQDFAAFQSSSKLKIIKNGFDIFENCYH